MPERVKTVSETKEMLGVGRATVYNLLQRGDLKRAPSLKRDGKGRPVTLVTVSSIVNYINNH